MEKLDTFSTILFILCNVVKKLLKMYETDLPISLRNGAGYRESWAKGSADFQPIDWFIDCVMIYCIGFMFKKSLR